MQEVKQKLERFKHLLRLERKKNDRTQEKAKRLTTSLNGFKTESNKQKQLINKFLLDAAGNKAVKPVMSEEVTNEETEMPNDDEMIQVIDADENVYEIRSKSEEQEVTTHHSKPEMTSKKSSPKNIQNNLSIGSELLRRIVTGNNSRKG